MSHSNTQRLTDYWRARRGVRMAPLRASVDPADFADLLPQVFILGRLSPGRFVFRLSGALLGDLHDRNLRQSEFGPLWATADRPQLGSAMESALRRGQALVIEAEGHTRSDKSAELEILLAPMTSTGEEVDRFLGLYQPTSALSRLRDEPIGRLSIKQILPVSQHADGQAQPLAPLRLAAVHGRRIA